MNTNSLPSSAAVSGRFVRSLSLFVAVGALTVSALAQAPADPNANGGGRRNRGGDNGNGNGNGNGGGRGNFDPAQMQEQMMARLRERFAVTDDAEWALISERITKVTEARRATGGGLGGGAMAMFGRGGPGGGGGGDRGGNGGGGGGGRGRGGNTGNPEMDSLRAALEDKLPDAEVKSRLTRLRDSRKDNEEKLHKAQEDLRSVLTVRQEALAVMAGLLP